MGEFNELPAHFSDRKHWLPVWQNLRSQVMPPTDEDQPTPAATSKVLGWIEKEVFKLDPANPDPGRVTIRRLNRTEYQNAVHDLPGVEYNTREIFPPDDNGYGSDNIGSVLSMSPPLIEKHLTAADEVVALALPDGAVAQVPHVDIAERNSKDSGDPKTTGDWLPFAKTRTTSCPASPIRPSSASTSASRWINALGQFSTREHGKPIGAAGKLLTGEEFADVADLKQILATGRSVEYYDSTTIAQLTARLEKTTASCESSSRTSSRARPSKSAAATSDPGPGVFPFFDRSGALEIHLWTAASRKGSTNSSAARVCGGRGSAKPSSRRRSRKTNISRRTSCSTAPASWMRRLPAPPFTGR